MFDGDDDAYAACRRRPRAVGDDDDDDDAAPFALPPGMRAYDASDYVGIGRNQAGHRRAGRGSPAAAFEAGAEPRTQAQESEPLHQAGMRAR